MKAGVQPQIILVSSGDLRLSANQNCWAAQHQMEQMLQSNNNHRSSHTFCGGAISTHQDASVGETPLCAAPPRVPAPGLLLHRPHSIFFHSYFLPTVIKQRQLQTKTTTSQYRPVTHDNTATQRSSCWRYTSSRVTPAPNAALDA